MASKETYQQELRERAVLQKHLDDIVTGAMKRVIAAVAHRKPAIKSHFFYGASAIHPRHLVTWYLFQTDSEWQTAKSNGLISDIEKLTRQELVEAGYPADGAKEMMVSFTSDEDIQRTTGGDYRAYFQ